MVETVDLTKIWEETDAPSTWTSSNVKAMKEIATGKIIPLPEGFSISAKKGENTIAQGVVVTDGQNEFVWIPVENASSYAEDSFGPLTDKASYFGNYVWDSQEELDYFYGTGYYDYDDFTYEADKTKVETSVQTYGGFYIGRYETTIDGTTIGVQRGKTVLICETLLRTGENTNFNNQPFYYRWWGLYKAQKEMYANNLAVGSLMMSSKQWDAIMTYTGYENATRAEDTYTTTPDLSGSAYKTDNTKYDVSQNIYDLAGNVTEFTITADNKSGRTLRGGFYWGTTSSASYKITNEWPTGGGPAISYAECGGSRVALYIK